MKVQRKAWIAVAALLLIAPTSLLAQSHASKDFEEIAGVNVPAAGVMTFDLQLTAPGTGSFPDVGTGDIPVGAGMSGDDVTELAVEAICAAAVAPSPQGPYRCSGLGAAWADGNCGPDYGGAAAECCTLAFPALPSDVTCTHPSKGPSLGFHIKRDPTFSGIPKFDIDAVGVKENIKNLKHTTTAGNSVGDDILSRYCLQVDRGSSPVNGVIDFKVRHFHGTAAGVQTSTFSVDSTGLDDLALHNAIRDQFLALGLGLDAAVTVTADDAKLLCGGLAAEIALPNVVTITNVPGRGGIITIFTDAQPGQKIIANTSLIADEGVIPTLSEWGLILLVALLSLSALWMLHRRRQIGNAV